jgi:hypothetical protein
VRPGRTLHADHGGPAAALDQSSARRAYIALPSYRMWALLLRAGDDILAKEHVALLSQFPVKSGAVRVSGMQP